MRHATVYLATIVITPVLVGSLASTGQGARQPGRYTVVDLGELPVGGAPKEWKDTHAHEAHAINAAGDVAGIATADNQGVLGFYYSSRDRRIRCLETPQERAYVYDINDHGQVVGSDDGYMGTPCLWEDGRIQPLERLRAGRPCGATAFALNNRGEVLGKAWGQIGNTPGEVYCVWTGNKTTVIGVPYRSLPVGLHGRTCDINDRGQIVVTTGTGRGGMRAYLYENGEARDLGTLGGSRTAANAINERGQIAGMSVITWEPDLLPGLDQPRDPWREPWRPHAVLWENGSLRDLGTLGGLTSEALDINNAGDVVGWSFSETGEMSPNRSEPEHAFICRDGHMQDLNDLIPRNSGWLLSIAYAMNDRGEIVGWGYRRGHGHTAFLLRPLAR